MASTYEPIATTTLSSSVANVTFSSIASTYTDLYLVISDYGNVTVGTDIFMRFNSDSGTNYSVTFMYGTGSSALSSRTTNASGIRLGYNDNYSPMLRVNIMNYSNSTTNKTILSRDDSASNVTEATVGLWRSTAAINTVTILASSGNLNAGTYTLYGIKAA